MRDQFNAFVARHDVAWELAMALLAIVYVAIGFALDDPALQPMAASLETTEVVLTMTAVGYGDVVPQPAEGRIAASALMLLGIGLFSAVTAIITSFLVAGRGATADPITSLERLGALAASGTISPEEFAAKRVDL